MEVLLDKISFMNLRQELKETIAEILGINPDSFQNDTEAADIENWDSVNNVIILSTLEEKYDVMFPDDDLFDLVSVDAIAEEIEKLKA